MENKLNIKLLMFKAFFLILFFKNLIAMETAASDAESSEQLKNEIQSLEEEARRGENELGNLIIMLAQQRQLMRLKQEQKSLTENFYRMEEENKNLRKNLIIQESRKQILLCVGFISLGIIIYYCFKKTKQPITPNNTDDAM